MVSVVTTSQSKKYRHGIKNNIQIKIMYFLRKCTFISGNFSRLKHFSETDYIFRPQLTYFITESSEYQMLKVIKPNAKIK